MLSPATPLRLQSSLVTVMTMDSDSGQGEEGLTFPDLPNGATVLGHEHDMIIWRRPDVLEWDISRPQPMLSTKGLPQPSHSILYPVFQWQEMEQEQQEQATGS
jgi:hypothetical protein